MLNSWLAGVRVIDLGQYLPGPGAAQILADLGADVLKVEQPSGDPLRALDPVTGRSVEGISPYYAAVNAGKRVLRLDLKSDAGKRAFERLAHQADALIESFRPGALAKLGLGAERLRALNPRLVHVALSGYGQTGPLAQQAGHDLNYLAFAGALAASGPFASPAIAFPPVADHASAMHAALCALGGLQGRARTGRGTFVDVSLAESVLAWQSWGLTAAGFGAAPSREAAMLNGGAAYYRVYRTRDGKFISLGAIEKPFWRNFCEAAGRPEWIPRHADPLPQTGLIAEVAALVAAASRAEWDRRLGGVDCCYQAVLDYGEIADRPHVAARGLVRRVPADSETGVPAHVEAAFAAIVDGNTPRRREPFRDVSAEEALAAWETGL
ncbi:MAG: CoA transferase [Rhodospirillales bacterium]|nr:CoA transferase [Rhodospirillales bacterium]